jgi:hypothetical protein
MAAFLRFAKQERMCRKCSTHTTRKERFESFGEALSPIAIASPPFSNGGLFIRVNLVEIYGLRC